VGVARRRRAAAAAMAAAAPLSPPHILPTTAAWLYLKARVLHGRAWNDVLSMP